MQAAILQRFIVHVGFMADLKEMWRDGIILRTHEGTALIEAFPDKSEIVIRLEDIGQITLLTRILNKFTELDVEKGVEEELVSLDGTNFLKLKQLEQHPVQLEKIQGDTGEWLDVADYRVFLKIDRKLNFHKESNMEKIILQKNMTKDVFICHASEDKLSIVEPLANAILEKGFKVWYDKIEIKWGDSITDKINEGLKNSKYVVLVLSIAFLNKHWPKKEMNAALNLEIGFGNKKILPLIVGNNEERAAILQQIPLQNDKRFLIWNNSTEEVIEALIEVLK